MPRAVPSSYPPVTLQAAVVILMGVPLHCCSGAIVLSTRPLDLALCSGRSPIIICCCYRDSR